MVVTPTRAPSAAPAEPPHVKAFQPGDELQRVDQALQLEFDRPMVGIDAVRIVGDRRDSDRDGVLDEDDACPETPAGARVTARGCSVRQMIASVAARAGDLEAVAPRRDEHKLRDAGRRLAAANCVPVC